MRRLNMQDPALSERVVFAPALTPMEAAMLPAGARPRRGALALCRAQFAPGEKRRSEGLTLPRLSGWGPHRQKI